MTIADSKTSIGNVIADIIIERMRQVTDEWWSAEHDDEENYYGELAEAAACYALPDYRAPLPWPWEPPNYDKRNKHSRRRQLIIAGALIVAEVERLDRATAAAAYGHNHDGNCCDNTNSCTECGDGNLCDVCHKHHEARGDCDRCQPCKACEDEL